MCLSACKIQWIHLINVNLSQLTTLYQTAFCSLYFVIGFGASLQIASTTVLSMVLSQVFVQKIGEQTNSIRQMTSVNQICRQTLEIRDSMDLMNRMVGFAIFLKIVINGVIMASGFCTLADNITRPTPNYFIIVALIFEIIPQNIDLFIACRSSQRVIDAMDLLCKATEERIAREDFMSISDKQKFDLILSFKDRICFRAAQVLDISQRTFLYVINLTATYAIILIQTD